MTILWSLKIAFQDTWRKHLKVQFHIYSKFWTPKLDKSSPANNGKPMLRVETRHQCMDCGPAPIIALHGVYYANSQEQCRLSAGHKCEWDQGVTKGSTSNILRRGCRGPHEEAIVIAAESQSPKTTKEYGGLRSVQCGGTRQPS